MATTAREGEVTKLVVAATLIAGQVSEEVLLRKEHLDRENEALRFLTGTKAEHTRIAAPPRRLRSPTRTAAPPRRRRSIPRAK